MVPIIIDLFTDMAALLNIEFITFKKYYGMPREAKKKENFTVYFSEKGEHYYIQTQNNNIFSHYDLFLGKLNEKLARKAPENTERVYGIVLMSPPPGIP